MNKIYLFGECFYYIGDCYETMQGAMNAYSVENTMQDGDHNIVGIMKVHCYDLHRVFKSNIGYALIRVE